MALVNLGDQLRRLEIALVELALAIRWGAPR